EATDCASDSATAVATTACSERGIVAQAHAAASASPPTAMTAKLSPTSCAVDRFEGTISAITTPDTAASTTKGPARDGNDGGRATPAADSAHSREAQGR